MSLFFGYVYIFGQGASEGLDLLNFVLLFAPWPIHNGIALFELLLERVQ